MVTSTRSSSRKVPFKDITRQRFYLQPVDDVKKLKDLHTIDIPRFESDIELYVPNGMSILNMSDGDRVQALRVPIIARTSQDTEGKTYLATIHLGRLGVKERLMRIVSEKHRKLYVGSLSSLREDAQPENAV